MKIDNSGLVTSLTQTPKEGVKPEKPEMVNTPPLQTTAKAGQNDAITFTDAVAHMQNLEQVITTQPVVNDQRVERLQKVINEGGPDITPFDLATRMLNFEKDLNNART